METSCFHCRSYMKALSYFKFFLSKNWATVKDRNNNSEVRVLTVTSNFHFICNVKIVKKINTLYYTVKASVCKI